MTILYSLLRTDTEYNYKMAYFGCISGQYHQYLYIFMSHSKQNHYQQYVEVKEEFYQMMVTTESTNFTYSDKYLSTYYITNKCFKTYTELDFEKFL